MAAVMIIGKIFASERGVPLTLMLTLVVIANIAVIDT